MVKISVKAVERAAVNYLAVWAHDIIRQHNLAFHDMPKVDTREITLKPETAKYPDFILQDKRKTSVFLIEFKSPNGWTPYDPELVDDAHGKASRQGIRFFGTSNFNKLVIWRTDLEGVPLMERYIVEYDLAEPQLRTVEDIDLAVIQKSLKERLVDVLKELELLYKGKLKIKKKAIDAFFIELLRTHIDSFYVDISNEIQEKRNSDVSFNIKLLAWFTEHGWTFEEKQDNYERVAKQFLLLLINKVLFYNALRLKKGVLDPLVLITDEEDAAKFRAEIGNYFDKVLEIDYESIYTSNFIDEIPIPNHLVPRLVSFINSLSDKYDFSKVNYEIMGRIFENLIPEKERHNLGQFFTDALIVDLINAYCVKNADDSILDPSCGAGTFLVRGYILKKIKDSNQDHEDIIREIYGFDISKFASHLSNVNLSIRDLSAQESYPRIIHGDFFDIQPKHMLKEYFKSKTLSGALIDVEIPFFDAVVGNPPYTRQEEIKQMFGPDYKEKINHVLKREIGTGLQGTASIYAYFFLHGTAFLKNNGTLGFITSNSWLHADYGRTLQQFFLDNYKVKVLIESKVERWFEYADTNTAIIIAERCLNKTQRDLNIAKFVQLKDSLSNLIPRVGTLQATDDSENFVEIERRRFREIRKFINKISKENEFYEDASLKIVPKAQNSLYNECKWEQFIRAPKIYFKLGSNDNLKVLRDFAKVKFGLKTGDNKFFHFTDDTATQWKISSRYLRPLFKSPQEADGVLIDVANLSKKVLIIDGSDDQLEKSLVDYLLWGERNGVSKGSTVSQHTPNWYNLGLGWESNIACRAAYGKVFSFFFSPQPIICDKRLYTIRPDDETKSKLITALLNSTLTALFCELQGRTQMGQGALELSVNETEELLLIDIEKLSQEQITKIEECFDKLIARPTLPIDEEIKQDDKRELDKIVFDFLGLSSDERIEILDGIVDLVQSRLSRASSIVKVSKDSTEKMSNEAIIESVISETDTSELKSFPDDYLQERVMTRDLTLPKADGAVTGSNLIDGIHVAIGDRKITCQSHEEARYIRFAVLNGKTLIKIPLENDEIKAIVTSYDRSLDRISSSIDKALAHYAHDTKTKTKLKAEVMKRIGQID